MSLQDVFTFSVLKPMLVTDNRFEWKPPLTLVVIADPILWKGFEVRSRRGAFPLVGLLKAKENGRLDCVDVTLEGPRNTVL